MHLTSYQLLHTLQSAQTSAAKRGSCWQVGSQCYRIDETEQ